MNVARVEGGIVTNLEVWPDGEPVPPNLVPYRTGTVVTCAEDYDRPDYDPGDPVEIGGSWSKTKGFTPPPGVTR